ncbi:unnamed protein product [Amoebophrya sp. A25]|nr:unnamed protein product [Amoebophrya sp. A25]|eukprot:GSA25T00015497001.1
MGYRRARATRGDSYETKIVRFIQRVFYRVGKHAHEVSKAKIPDGGDGDSVDVPARLKAARRRGHVLLGYDDTVSEDASDYSGQQSVSLTVASVQEEEEGRATVTHMQQQNGGEEGGGEHQKASFVSRLLSSLGITIAEEEGEATSQKARTESVHQQSPTTAATENSSVEVGVAHEWNAMLTRVEDDWKRFLAEYAANFVLDLEFLVYFDDKKGAYTPDARRAWRSRHWKDKGTTPAYEHLLRFATQDVEAPRDEDHIVLRATSVPQYSVLAASALSSQWGGSSLGVQPSARLEIAPFLSPASRFSGPMALLGEVKEDGESDTTGASKVADHEQHSKNLALRRIREEENRMKGVVMSQLQRGQGGGNGDNKKRAFMYITLYDEDEAALFGEHNQAYNGRIVEIVPFTANAPKQKMHDTAHGSACLDTASEVASTGPSTVFEYGGKRTRAKIRRNAANGNKKVIKQQDYTLQQPHHTYLRSLFEDARILMKRLEEYRDKQEQEKIKRRRGAFAQGGQPEYSSFPVDEFFGWVASISQPLIYGSRPQFVHDFFHSGRELDYFYQVAAPAGEPEPLYNDVQQVHPSSPVQQVFFQQMLTSSLMAQHVQQEGFFGFGAGEHDLQFYNQTQQEPDGTYVVADGTATAPRVVNSPSPSHPLGVLPEGREDHHASGSQFDLPTAGGDEVRQLPIAGRRVVDTSALRRQHQPGAEVLGDHDDEEDLEGSSRRTRGNSAPSTTPHQSYRPQAYPPQHEHPSEGRQAYPPQHEHPSEGRLGPGQHFQVKNTFIEVDATSPGSGGEDSGLWQGQSTTIGSFGNKRRASSAPPLLQGRSRFLQ